MRRRRAAALGVLAALALAGCGAEDHPNDPRPPAITSGLRIGSPASTTRGFREAEMNEVANLIADFIDSKLDPAVIARSRDRVADLCRRFPVYGGKV